jgi:glutaredoxin-related protein
MARLLELRHNKSFFLRKKNNRAISIGAISIANQAIVSMIDP